MSGRSADPLAVICPYCLAEEGSPCIVHASGRLAPTPHAMRREAAIRLELKGGKRRKRTIEVDMRPLRQLVKAVGSCGCRFDAGRGWNNVYRCLYCGASTTRHQHDEACVSLSHSLECPARVARKLLAELDIIRDNEERRHE